MKKDILLPLMLPILGLFGVVLVGCSLDDENDCTSQSNTFTIVGYNGLVAKGEDELIFGGAEGEFAVVGADFNTTFDSLMIVYQAFVAPFVSEAREPKGSFISGAYAECIPQPIQMVNFIDSVYIISNKDYTAAFPAGTNLASIFTVRQFNEDVGFLAEAVRIPEFLAQNRAIRGTSYEIPTGHSPFHKQGACVHFYREASQPKRVFILHTQHCLSLSRKKLVALTGAGISAESGLKTFRDSNGLWEGFDVMEVASIDGWYQDKAKVLDFYNMRRKQARVAKPNQGHLALAELEKRMDVTIVTQNVDDLHEQAGSTKVIHLHGELFKSKSTIDDTLIYDVKGWELSLGDLCEKGSQLRPHIVWFGEMVPMMEMAAEHVAGADILMIVGTSMAVYPAAGLIDYALPEIDKYIIDPSIPKIRDYVNIITIAEPATTGVAKAARMIIEKFH